MATSNLYVADSFGEILKIALEIEGISQVELAQLLNKGQPQVSRWINNVSEPQYKTVNIISNVLNGTLYADKGKWNYIQGNFEQISDDPEPYKTKSESEKDAVIKRLEAQVDVLMDLIIKLKVYTKSAD